MDEEAVDELAPPRRPAALDPLADPRIGARALAQLDPPQVLAILEPGDEPGEGGPQPGLQPVAPHDDVVADDPGPPAVGGVVEQRHQQVGLVRELVVEAARR